MEYGVHLHTRTSPEADRKFKRMACNSTNMRTKLDAARAARAHVIGVLGAAVVEAAELLVQERRAVAGPSAGVERTVNAVLGETQRLKAQLTLFSSADCPFGSRFIATARTCDVQLRLLLQRILAVRAGLRNCA